MSDHVIIECQTTYSPTAFDEKKVDTGAQFDKLNFSVRTLTGLD